MVNGHSPPPLSWQCQYYLFICYTLKIYWIYSKLLFAKFLFSHKTTYIYDVIVIYISWNLEVHRSSASKRMLVTTPGLGKMPVGQKPPDSDGAHIAFYTIMLQHCLCCLMFQYFRGRSGARIEAFSSQSTISFVTSWDVVLYTTFAISPYLVSHWLLD